MNIEEIIVEAIRNATSDVFTTMLGAQLGPGEVSIESSMPDANDGVVSFIGVAGPWAGTGSLACSPSMACRICSQMLLSESQAVNEEVLDAIAELTNMIVGNAKTELERHVGPLGLSLPTVVFGRNFKARSAGHNRWILVKFDWEGELLLVRLCLTPNERGVHPLPHANATAYALEV